MTPDHDGHTVNVGPVTVGVDTDAIRANYCSGQRRANWEAYIFGDVAALCDEVDRLRAALEAASAHAVEASDYADRYKAENDRLRAENDEYSQMQKAFKAHMRAVDQVALPLAKDDGEGGKWHGGKTALLVLKDGVAELLGLRAENDRLQDLLAKALPWIDPNDSHEDYLLTVAIREALGEES